MNMQNIYEKATAWMLQRGWKKLTAKHRDFEQSLFEHTRVELDALSMSFPPCKKENNLSLFDG